MSTANAVSSRPRVYYLDWLRVLAMIGIFFFHNARFYDVFTDWHVRNATTNAGASVVVAFMGVWIMPLFFLIAGAGTYFALGTRKAGQFIGERTLRLFIPLIFGMLVIVVPQAYFEAVSHGVDLSGNNLLQIYWLYLQTLPDLNWFHLWFLAFLFVFSLVTVPIFVNSVKSGKSIASRIAGGLSNPWALFPLLVLSLAVVNTLIYPTGFWGSRGSGGWNIISYILFFIFGYMIFANSRIMEKIKKLTWPILGAAVVSGICLVVFFYEQLTDLEATYGSAAFIGSQVLQAVTCWSWLLAILGLGSRYLNGTNRFLVYTNEAVLPFYILHQTVIIVIGYYVVQWNTGVGLKYLTISTTSFAAIMLIYELLVRRVNVLRFLFGMRFTRPKRVPKAAPVKATDI
jgi:peptidoglycan/LPS O-acetylase OafA/YrhL